MDISRVLLTYLVFSRCSSLLDALNPKVDEFFLFNIMETELQKLQGQICSYGLQSSNGGSESRTHKFSQEGCELRAFSFPGMSPLSYH